MNGTQTQRGHALFDADGCETGAGTLVGDFRRPSWLKKVE